MLTGLFIVQSPQNIFSICILYMTQIVSSKSYMPSLKLSLTCPISTLTGQVSSNYSRSSLYVTSKLCIVPETSIKSLLGTRLSGHEIIISMISKSSFSFCESLSHITLESSLVRRRNRLNYFCILYCHSNSC